MDDSWNKAGDALAADREKDSWTRAGAAVQTRAEYWGYVLPRSICEEFATVAREAHP